MGWEGAADIYDPIGLNISCFCAHLHLLVSISARLSLNEPPPLSLRFASPRLASPRLVSSRHPLPGPFSHYLLAYAFSSAFLSSSLPFRSRLLLSRVIPLSSLLQRAPRIVSHLAVRREPSQRVLRPRPRRDANPSIVRSSRGSLRAERKPCVSLLRDKGNPTTGWMDVIAVKFLWGKADSYRTATLPYHDRRAE